MEPNISIKLTYQSQTQTLKIKREDNLNDVFKNFLLQNNLKLLEPKYYFFLIKNEKVEKQLSKEKKIFELDLDENDEILISYKELHLSRNKEQYKVNICQNNLSSNEKEETSKVSFNQEKPNIHNYKNDIKPKKRRNIKNRKENMQKETENSRVDIMNGTIIYNRNINKESKYLLLKIILFILSVLILIGIIIIIIKFYFKSNKKQPNEINIKQDNLIIQKKYPPNLYMRFMSKKESLITVESQEIKNENKSSIIYQISDFIFIIRDKFIEKDQINKIEKEWYEGYIAFMKITLKNETNDMTLVYDKILNNNINKKNNSRIDKEDLQYIGEEGNICFVRLDFYQNGEIKNYYIPNNFSIDNFVFVEDVAKLIIPKISSNLYVKSINDTLNEILSDNTTGIPSNIILNSTRRILSQKKNNKSKVQQDLYKTLTINSSGQINFTEKNTTEDIELEEYLTEPSTESINLDLREANIFNDSNSNLTQFSMGNVESDDFKMEDSIKNVTTYSIINDEGILESVQELSTTIFKSQISDDDMENNNEEGSQFNNIRFNISNLLVTSSHIINCSEYYINEELNQFLYKYFDSYTYKLYEEEEEKVNNYTLEDNGEINKIRNLQEINEFYGQKKISNTKKIYSYNLLGLRMEKQILSEIDPSTGISNSYIVIIFGSKNLKIKLQEQYSNLHIITEKRNQMGYNLIQLLDQSNMNLIRKSMNYLDVILDIEKNITYLFENVYDYSNLFKDHLNNMYDEVNDFTGKFFEELISLISRIYVNYTIILSNAQNRKYDIINKIRYITKEEYIHYIYNMLNALEIFENNTLIFLDNIEEELEHLNTFHIDLLYDIKDEIYESRLIFKQFNRNLFKSIEKGIITFKYNITEFIDEIIGDLLYITDFLSVNIDKNEILKNAIENNLKEEVKLKLKNFRNIILEIIDLLILDINDDFQSEIDLGNKNSIKFISNQKADKFLSKTEGKSNKVINDIKKKINNIELFELYSNNIDIINSINNKTIIENINEMSNNIINNFIKLQPEYFNNKSDLIKKKDKLFYIVKNIINETNNDISEINNFIANYTQNYMEKYLYDMHYNLYYFKNYFIKQGLEELSNDINILLNNTFNIYLKNIINSNFNLAMLNFKDAVEYFEECNYKKKLVGTKVTEAFERGNNNFRIFTESISSDEIPNLFEKYINNMKNIIINNVKNKILVINKYYFNNELYKDIFYLNEQIYNEIIKLTENFNNYFNEIYFSNLKINTSELITSILKYQTLKTQEFINYFNNILFEKLYKNKIKDSNKYDLYCYPLWGLIIRKRKKYDYWGVDYMRTNLKNAELENYLNWNFEIIISNYNLKYEQYLNNYIYKTNILYSNLYNYIQNKIENNEKNNILLNNYQMIFNNIIKNDTNYGLLYKLNNKNTNIMNNISLYLNYLNNNTNLLIDKFYSLYYLNNSTNFLEYPEEIIYKINQFLKELNDSSIIIKDLINFNYQKKIKNIIFSTNSFIHDVINNHFDYILININKNNIIKEYYLNKYNKIKKTFNDCMNHLKNASNNVSIENTLFLDFENYDEPIKKIMNNSKDFILYLEDIIDQNFTSMNDYNNTFEINNSIFIKEKKKFSLNISKYNYNIIKLREGIYYSKTLLENIDNLVNVFNFDKLVNIDKIKYNDELLNDKDIIHIYNKTNYKLNKINEDSSLQIDEYFKLFVEDFKTKYSYNNDYLNLLEKFKEIVMFKDNKYQNEYNNKQNYIISLLNEFNETLYKQLFLAKKYDFYNFNKSYFSEQFYHYYSQIENIFSTYIYNISSLNKSFIFHNSIKNIFRKLQSNKRNNFKNIINDFSKNYDFNLLLMSFDIGENSRYFMEKDYYDFEFNNVYNYVELFENHTQKFINKIIFDINNLKNLSLENFRKIYDKFYSNFSKNSSEYININYIKESEYNKTVCLDYSYEILKEKKGNNEILFEKYNKYLSLINLTFIICLYNDSNIIDSEKYTINEKIDYIRNIKYDCFNYLSNLENESYYNESIILIDCYINNFYNSNIFYFNNFENNCKRKLDEIINNIKFNISYFNEYSFFSNLEENYSLVPYENITFTDISYNFDDIEAIINYINYIKNDEYKEYLSDLLINSFNYSYIYFINNYVLDEVIDNITILVNNKFNLHLKYLEMKLIDEYYYYILILNDTEEMGDSSKDAFLNLYKNINKKLNDTFFYLIKEDIYFYLNIFFKDYKKIVKNNFIDYYFYNLNKFDIYIFKLKEFLEDII